MTSTKIPNQYILDESLGFLAGRFFRLILKRNSEKFLSHGFAITSEQWIVLVHLWTQDGITQQILAELMHKDKSSTARLIRGLENQGLLYRVVGVSDAREKNVCLTDKGKNVMQQATQLVYQVLETSYSGIDLTELRICKDVLRQAYSNLE